MYSPYVCAPYFVPITMFSRELQPALTVSSVGVVYVSHTHNLKRLWLMRLIFTIPYALTVSTGDQLGDFGACLTKMCV